MYVHSTFCSQNRAFMEGADMKSINWFCRSLEGAFSWVKTTPDGL